jgi:hypothetical protein
MLPAGAGAVEGAEYGDESLKRLAARLTKRFGKGVGVATLRRSRAFYLTYPKGSTIPPTSVRRSERSPPGTLRLATRLLTEQVGAEQRARRFTKARDEPVAGGKVGEAMREGRAGVRAQCPACSGVRGEATSSRANHRAQARHQASEWGGRRSRGRRGS